MSLQKKTQVETNVWSLEISIAADAFKAAIQKVYRKQRGRINVPGFRPGKAPLPFIERYFGKEVFYDDALEELYPDAIASAYEEGEIQAVSAPFDMDVSEIGETGVTFTVKVTVKPEVSVKKYQGLQAEKNVVEVTDDEVMEEIGRMQDRNSRIVTVERAAQDGDITVIDFEGFVDEVAFDGGKGENYELTLGSGQFIPGFEAQIIGHSAGEAFAVNVTFPEEYAEELKGKDAVFQVKLHEVKVKELPELDDEFAKDLGEYETVDELKAGVHKDIEARKQEQEDHAFEHRVLDALAQELEGEIPEVMFENRAKDNIQNMSQSLAQQGVDLDTYLMYMGMERPAYEAQMQEQAKEQVRTDLALEVVAKLEKLDPAPEEVDAEYQSMADKYSMEVDKVKQIVSEDSIKDELRHRAAIRFVVTHADTTAPEEKPDAKKPAAKKPAAKKTAAKKTAAKADVAEEMAEAKKPAAKKPAAKKPAAKKTPAKADAAEEKPAAKKPAAKKPAAKKAAPKKADAE